MSKQLSNLYEIIEYQAKKSKKKVALLADEHKVTYIELLQKVDIVAGFLKENNIQKGDKVALFLRNSPEFIYSVFAISKLGAIVVPINTFLKEEELDYILKDSDTKLIIASKVHKTVVDKNSICNNIIWEGLEDSDSGISFKDILNSKYTTDKSQMKHDECAVIIYTSGTTGKPKGAMLSNKNILSNIEYSKKLIEVTPKDRLIVFLPMFHTFTFTVGVIMPLFVGGSMVIIKSLQPFSNIFKQTLTKRVTLFFGIPDVYNALAKAKLPWYFLWFNNIRVFISGAAALQPKTLDAMSKKFKKAKLLEGYGLSEASPVVCVNTIKKQKVGSVGCAMYGHEVKVVDKDLNELKSGEVGDIIVKGDNIMMGYLNRPNDTEDTIVNGWLLTGDMDYLDSENFLFIVDRKKDLIISKGINIYPREIEEVIDGFVGIKASAVIGIFDEHSGEIPVAYIELDDAVLSVDERELKVYIRRHLANYKIPKHIYVIDELPKNATGKVLKRLLKENLKE